MVDAAGEGIMTEKGDGMKKLMKSELFKALLGLIGLALIIAAILGVRRAVYYMTFRSELDLPEGTEYTVNIIGPSDGMISLSGEDALDIIGAARELSFAGPINRDIYQGSVNDYYVTISGQSGYARITLFELDNPVLWTPERDVKLGNTGPLLDAVEAAYSYATDIELPAEPYSELSAECEWFTLRDASASMLEGRDYSAFRLGDGAKLLIEPKTELSSFTVNRLEYTDAGCAEGEQLFRVSLTPQEPLLLELPFDGAASGYSLKFFGGDTVYTYALTMGGLDPDEACPYNLEEYER